MFRLIFNSYDVAMSLREARREKRVRRGKLASTPSTIGSQIPLLVQRNSLSTSQTRHWSISGDRVRSYLLLHWVVNVRRPTGQPRRSWVGKLFLMLEVKEIREACHYTNTIWRSHEGYGEINFHANYMFHAKYVHYQGERSSVRYFARHTPNQKDFH